MVTEKTIRDAYVYLRTTNNSIPDETLDFMLKASLEKLSTRVIDINKEKEALEEQNRENLPTFNKDQLH